MQARGFFLANFGGWNCLDHVKRMKKCSQKPALRAGFFQECRNRSQPISAQTTIEREVSASGVTASLDAIHEM
jgi:hypothetical protein